MPKKSKPLQIIQDYIDYLNSVFNSTVSDSRLTSLKSASANFRVIARYQSGSRLPLELKPSGFLFFDQLVQTVEKVRTEEQQLGVEVSSYVYIFSWSEDRGDEEAWIFRYEYEREPAETIRPHAHLHVNAQRQDINVRDIHFPTGRISIEQLIAHLVLEYGIESKLSIDDTINFLRQSHKGFVERRTDLLSPPFP